MADIGYVIEGLEKAKNVIEAWIPMFEQYNSPFAIDCAIELLKEQDKIIQNILREKTNELNDKVTALQIEAQNQEMKRLLEQK